MLTVEEERRIKANVLDLYLVKYLPNHDTVVLDLDASIGFWNRRKNKLVLFSDQILYDKVVDLAVSNRYIIFSTSNNNSNKTYIYPIVKNKGIVQLSDKPLKVLTTSRICELNLISPDEKYFLSVFNREPNKKDFYFVDLSTFKSERFRSFTSSEFQLAAFSPNGKYLAVNDDNLNVYRISDKEVVYSDFTNRSFRIGFDNKNRLLYTIPNNLRIVDLETGELSAIPYSINNFSVSRDNKLIAYTCFCDSKENIYVQPFDSGNKEIICLPRKQHPLSFQFTKHRNIAVSYITGKIKEYKIEKNIKTGS